MASDSSMNSGQLISNVVNNLPIDKMISAPLTASIKAQSEMSMAMAQFINSVGLDENGKIRMVNFNYADTSNGGNTERHIQAPFIAITGVPNLAIESVDISFELSISSAETSNSNTSESTNLDVKSNRWFSPVTASMTGSVSHSSSQTRSTDTRAKYSFQISARKQGTPEALQRIIDAITDSTANPQNNSSNENNLLPNSGASTNNSGKK